MKARARMTIGVYANVTRYGGGIYQYSISILHSLALLDYDVVVLGAPGADINAENIIRKTNFKYFNLQQIKFYDSYCKFLSRLSRLRIIPKGLIKRNNPLNNISKSLKIDLMLYPFPTPLVSESYLPSICAVHDLAHKTLPGFPEFSNFREKLHREFLLKNTIKDALYILADSQVGRNQINKYYKKNIHNIKVMPFLPDFSLLKTEHIDVNQKFSLPDKYIYYPAQFWLHKNHKNLVNAIHHLKLKEGITIPLVLSGAKKNGYDQFVDLVNELDIQEQIYYLGYVSDSEKAALYRNAIALVMPSFLGPTNIPQLEALLLGCPVILSRSQEGTAEQVGDAAIYVDPYSFESIANGIKKVWEDKDFREKLILKGNKVIKELTIEKQAFRLDSIIRDAGLQIQGSKQQ